MTSPNGFERPAPPTPPPPAPPMGGTPNAEKYVLAADAMRRRQLRSALLHGSRRTWREHPRVWPAIVVGVIAVAVVVAAIAVVGAFQKQQEKEKQEEEESNSLVWTQYDQVRDTRYVVRRADSSLTPGIHSITRSDESEGRH
ncbi:hypothetical protein MU582_10795 [Nocardioidaceae bacterium SCSIO 66511]|nr:hypothetical protein MU582_10795 [Nocardioidaceae bacterium SCSIO 66511]